jgi:ABC-2 type transport system permease protein
MRQIFAVFKRELGLYFRSPIAYAIAFALLLFFGLLFSSYVSDAVTNNPVAMQQGMSPIVADDIMPYVPNLLVFLLFLVGPLLTMRLISEEAREGTLEVLMTLPMSESQFIIGKFLAVWAYYTIILLLTVIYHIILTQVGVPDLGLAFAVYLGAWLYGGAVLAVSMIWSAVTEDQIVAAFLGAATILVLYLGETAALWAGDQGFSQGFVKFIRELGLIAHYQQTMLQGVLRAEDILYFVLLMIAALFITSRIVETRRWRA